MDYLEEDTNKPYENPKIASPEKKAELLEIRSKAVAAVNDLDKIAKLCEDKFGLKKNGISKWLSGENNKIRVLMLKTIMRRLSDKTLLTSLLKNKNARLVDLEGQVYSV